MERGQYKEGARNSHTTGSPSSKRRSQKKTLKLFFCLDRPPIIDNTFFGACACMGGTVLGIVQRRKGDEPRVTLRRVNELRRKTWCKDSSDFSRLQPVIPGPRPSKKIIRFSSTHSQPSSIQPETPQNQQTENRIQAQTPKIYSSLDSTSLSAENTHTSTTQGSTYLASPISSPSSISLLPTRRHIPTIIRIPRRSMRISITTSPSTSMTTTISRTART